MGIRLLGVTGEENHYINPTKSTGMIITSRDTGN